MALYHFSEDPGIALFEPHVAPTSQIQDEAFVWAIDDWHAPMYYVPRECPRACFWAGPATTAADRERWFSGLKARFVMVIESSWLERVASATLYRYTLPEDTFTSMGHAGGHFTSKTAVLPTAVEPVRNLLNAIATADVELRVTPRLGPLWRRVWQRSTLEFSGTRLRNASGFPEEFGA